MEHSLARRRVAKAVALIQREFHLPLRVETLARAAGMSQSSFHKHFKQITTLTPHQYQQELRLQEARRLLGTEAGDAASVAFQVGYESPSQFSREYARLFGLPPIQDRLRLGDRKA